MSNGAVERARQLVGVPFRPQGRDPALGLDCIGLVLAAYDLPPDLVRRNYRLRGQYKREMMSAFEPLFRRVPRARRRAGDIIMAKVHDNQFHLAVSTGTGLVHADARLRRLVELTTIPDWPVVAVYRRRVRAKAVR